jgi:hypothetical protein
VTLWTLRGPHYRAELDFNLDLFQVAILKLHDLVESLLANRFFGLRKGFVLALDNRPAHSALALFVTRGAGFQRHIEKQQSGGNLELLRQVEQFLARLRGERRGVHHAQTVHRKPLFNKEMHQRKGLRVAALVAFVIADATARPIRGNDLRGAKVALGKCGFSASRRATKHYNRWPEKAH